jgi:hypothetical protein
MTDMMTTIKGGLPCIARVTFFSPGCAGRVHGDPDDCYESEPDEIEFELLTATGQPTPWLRKAASEDDLMRIERQLLEQMK